MTLTPEQIREEKEMFVWKVKFSANGVSQIVNNSYTVTSETLSGALKKSKRMEDNFRKELADAGDDPVSSNPIGVELICRLDD